MGVKITKRVLNSFLYSQYLLGFDNGWSGTGRDCCYTNRENGCFNIHYIPSGLFFTFKPNMLTSNIVSRVSRKREGVCFLVDVDLGKLYDESS